MELFRFKYTVSLTAWIITEPLKRDERRYYWKQWRSVALIWNLSKLDSAPYYKDFFSEECCVTVSALGIICDRHILSIYFAMWLLKETLVLCDQTSDLLCKILPIFLLWGWLLRHLSTVSHLSFFQMRILNRFKTLPYCLAWVSAQLIHFQSMVWLPRICNGSLPWIARR